MTRVIVESPYAGDIERNTIYARRCMSDSLMRGEAPFLSHLLYTQVLDEGDRHQREQGIAAGLAWGECADFTAVYIDYCFTTGMLIGILAAVRAGRNVVYRKIGTN